MQIVTDGVGTVTRIGDRAELTVTFSAAAPTRTEAVALLEPKMGVLDVPVVAGAVLHRHLAVHDEWGKGKRPLGCRAGVDVTLQITDLAVVEQVVGLMVAAEPTQLTGPVWSLVDSADARREAQRLAVDDAREQAEGYAAATGSTLGALVRLVSGPDHGRSVAISYRGSDAADVTSLRLDPEPVAVSVRCTTTWDVAPLPA